MLVARQPLILTQPYSPDLTPSDYHLFTSLKAGAHGRNLIFHRRVGAERGSEVAEGDGGRVVREGHEEGSPRALNGIGGLCGQKSPRAHRQ